MAGNASLSPSLPHSYPTSGEHRSGLSPKLFCGDFFRVRKTALAMLQLTGSLFGSYSRPCDRASAGADYGKMTLEKVTGQEPCSHRCPCGPGCVPAKQSASFYRCEARARRQKNTHLPSNFEHLMTDCMNPLGIAWRVRGAPLSPAGPGSPPRTPTFVLVQALPFL